MIPRFVRRPDSVLVRPIAGLLLLGATAGAQLTEDFLITPSDAAAGDRFGQSVALAGGVAVVGAPVGDGLSADTGSAYLFDATTGLELGELFALDGASGDEFGHAVALDAGLVVVGARYDDDAGANSGSAYVFDVQTGLQLHKLVASDAAAGDEFGVAVAIADGVVAVGASRDDDAGTDSGAVYLYDAQTGVELAKLVAADAGPIATFGEAVALDAGLLAVGAHGDDENGPLAGAAYLFDVATGQQVAKLLANDGGSNDFLGAAIAMDDGVVAVGAWSDSVVFDHSGSTYLFDVVTGAQLHKLVPADAHDRDHFGWSVSIDAGVVAVGAEEDDDGAFDGGSAYFFRVDDGSELGELLVSSTATFDDVGTAVAFDAGRCVVGAPRDDDTGSNAGSVSVVASGFAAARESVRLGTPPNPFALLPGVTSGPVLGATWDPIVDHASFVPASALDLLVVSRSATALNVPTALGTVLCDPTRVDLFVGTPGAAFAVVVPSATSLAGRGVCAQAASWTASAGFALTNALDVTLGSF